MFADMTTCRHAAVALLLTMLLGCSKTTPNNAGAAIQPIIQRDVTEASYDQAVNETVQHAIGLISSSAPAETELDGDIAKLDALRALSQEKKVDAARAHEAMLLSTEGSIYAVKARLHKNSPRATGEFLTKSFNNLDMAVELHPQDLNARINRGIVSAKVPEFMGKTETAHEDLTFARDNPDFNKLTSELQGTIKALLTEVDLRAARADAGS